MKPISVLHVSSIERAAPAFDTLFDFTPKDEVTHSVVTLARPGGFTAHAEQRGLATFALSASTRWDYARVLGELAAIIDRLRPDILHAHLFDPTLLALLAAKIKRRKFMLTRHHADAHHRLRARYKRWGYLSLEQLINRSAARIIAPSQAVRDVLVNQEHVPAQKVRVIPYGQSFERFAAVTPAAIESARRELGPGTALVCVSRLFAGKGHSVLFAALAPLLRQGLWDELYLLGTGGNQTQLERLATRLGIAEHVHFLGWRDDALAIVASAEVMVHPSLEDALSQALIEGLMLGKPIVATDISGARDTLGDGRYGSLVPPNDALAFGEALRAVLSDLAAARRRAAPGRQHLLDTMSADKVALAHVEVYREVLAQ